MITQLSINYYVKCRRIRHKSSSMCRYTQFLQAIYGFYVRNSQKHFFPSEYIFKSNQTFDTFTHIWITLLFMRRYDGWFLLHISLLGYSKTHFKTTGYFYIHPNKIRIVCEFNIYLRFAHIWLVPHFVRSIVYCDWML